MSHEICCICDLPLHFTKIGAGDGSGNKFAHPECYWKSRANILELKVEDLRREIVSLRCELSKAGAECVKNRETLLDKFAGDALPALVAVHYGPGEGLASLGELADLAYTIARTLLARRSCYLEK